MRMSHRSFLELDNYQNNRQEKRAQRGFLQVHAGQRKIQLFLLSHFCVLPYDQLQLETQHILLLNNIHLSVRSIL
jgi:hypothetical protein